MHLKPLNQEQRHTAISGITFILTSQPNYALIIISKSNS